MTVNLKQFIALLPFFILIVTIIIVMLSISYHRNHFFVAFFSLLGLIISFFSLYFIIFILPVKISFLFYINKYSIYYMGVIIISSVASCIFAYPWLKNYLFNKEEFYLLALLSTLGSLGLSIADNMSSLFVTLELTFLPFFGLIAYSHFYKKSLESSFKYIILSGVSSSFLLLGISWIYAVSASFSFSNIGDIFDILFLNQKLVILFGISMILMFFCFKLSIVPFHLWTADIYQGTPSVVLSLFSTIGKISVFLALLHFFSYIPIECYNWLYIVLSFIIFSSIIFGNLMSLFQKNIKRLIGYTSISQLGYLFIVLLVLNKNYLFSLETVKIYLLGYLLSNIVFFGVINLVSNSNEKSDLDTIDSYKGLFWINPTLSVAMTISLISMAGIPVTLGFIGKFYILSIIVKEHFWFLGVSFLIGTLLGVYSYLRIIINLYTSKLLIKNKNISKLYLYTPSGIVILISSISLLIFGLYPNLLINLF